MNLRAEETVVAFFVFLFLFFGAGTLWQHELQHDFPYGYLASDTFQHQVRAESIKVMGDYQYEAPWIVAGYTDNVGFYPPVLYHLGVALSYGSGLETYDSAYLIVFLFALLASLAAYQLLKRWSGHALLILPFCLLLFAAASYAGFTWGSWPSLVSQAFLLLFAWSVLTKQKFWITGIALSAVALTHTSEVIFAAAFWGTLILYRLWKKEFKKEDWIEAIKTGVLFLLVSFWYLIIFYFTWAKAQPYQFSVVTDWGGTPVVPLGSFGVLLALMLLGLLLLFWKRDTRELGLFVLLMLVFGFGNLFGFDQRAFQLRQFWPVYLGIAAAVGLGFFLSLVRTPKLVSAGIAVLLALAFAFGAPFLPAVQKISSPGIMNPYHWALFQELKEFPDGKMLFFYGDIYGQNAVLRNSQHAPYLVLQQDYVAAVQNATVKRAYSTRLLGDNHGVYYAYRNGFFDFGYRALEVPKDEYHKMMDVCSFDYIVLDTVSSQPVFAQYNKIIAQLLLKNSWIQPAFTNEVAVVLRNSNPGAECLPEEVYVGS
ncbi:MAG: hypothetical protein Q7S65_00505 [Nanoarchaeota archaeon]|nr:hypothetical protein [Nanoarchaeota archaeon]